MNRVLEGYRRKEEVQCLKHLFNTFIHCLYKSRTEFEHSRTISFSSYFRV